MIAAHTSDINNAPVIKMDATVITSPATNGIITLCFQP